MRSFLFLLSFLGLLGTSPLAANEKGPQSAATPPADSDHPVLSKSDVATLHGLIDQNGKAVTQADFRGRFALVMFGYTSCPDVCPTGLSHITSVMEQLGPRAKYVRPVFVTFDPARDTSDVLGEFVSHFDQRTVALTGSPQKIKSVQEAFGVLSIFGDREADGSYFISHTAAKYLIAPDGSHIRSFTHDDAPEAITAYLNRIFEHIGM